MSPISPSLRSALEAIVHPSAVPPDEELAVLRPARVAYLYERTPPRGGETARYVLSTPFLGPVEVDGSQEEALRAALFEAGYQVLDRTGASRPRPFRPGA